MSGIDLVIMGLILVVGFYTAWNIGANDVANAMGTSVGSGALTFKQAVILAGIFEFLGAYLVGANVSETVRKKVFDAELLLDFHGEHAAMVLAFGMIASLMAAGTWLLIASYFGWPVSTTHSIVGAVVGFGCVGVGFFNVAWPQVGLITLGWVVSPALSGTLAFLLFRMLLKRVFFQYEPVVAAKRIAPKLVFVVVIVLIGVMVFKGLKPLWARFDINPFRMEVISFLLGFSALSGLIGAYITSRLVRNIHGESVELPNGDVDPQSARSLGKAAMHLRRVRDAERGAAHERVNELLAEVEDLYAAAREQTAYGSDSTELQKVERIFVFLQVLTACFVAFAHGSNDVANAVGPMSAAYQAIATGEVGLKAGVPTWTLALGGIGIITGLAMFGWRVIRTVGERITELTPSRGFCAEFSAAIIILLASILPLGLPVSTTHTLVGAVLGVGMARGIGAINLKMTRNIVVSWAFTIPAGAGLSITFFYLLKFVFLDSGLAG